MALDVTVCIATFGADSWRELAATRAVPSALALDVPIIRMHASSLREARNRALDAVTSELVCFLDADDELEPQYFDRIDEVTADVRAPAVRYVRNRFDQGVRMPRVAGHAHDCTAECLAFGNWIVIGAVAPTRLLKDVGGFRDFTWAEDWDLWVRCWQAGATIAPAPRAVYRAHVRRDSRNRGATQDEKNAAHRAIAEANGLLSPV